jgi:hypothetical protein
MLPFKIKCTNNSLIEKGDFFMSTEQTLDTINNTNLKTVGESLAGSLAMMYQDQAAHRARLNGIFEAATAKAIERIHSFSTDDAVAQGALLRGGANSDILSILGQIAAGSVANKTVAITPPETGVSRSLADLGVMLQVLQTMK